MDFAILLSGGTGTRMGTDVPKQYIEVKGKPVIAYAIEALLACGRFAHIQIVCADEYIPMIEEYERAGISFAFSTPGKTRQESIINALADIDNAKKADLKSRVLIHDAARPCVSKKLIDDCFKAIEGHEGVLPVLPMKDTVYECKDGVITSLLNRSVIFAGQAPELFLFKKYLKACRAMDEKTLAGINGSSEPAVLYKMDIATVRGDEGNFKITTPADLERFEGLI